VPLGSGFPADDYTQGGASPGIQVTSQCQWGQRRASNEIADWAVHKAISRSIPVCRVFGMPAGTATVWPVVNLAPGWQVHPNRLLKAATASQAILRSIDEAGLLSDVR